MNDTVSTPKVALSPQAADHAAAAAPPADSTPFIETEKLSLFYGRTKALKEVSMTIHEKLVTAFI